MAGGNASVNGKERECTAFKADAPETIVFPYTNARSSWDQVEGGDDDAVVAEDI